MPNGLWKALYTVYIVFWVAVPADLPQTNIDFPLEDVFHPPALGFWVTIQECIYCVDTSFWVTY